MKRLNPPGTSAALILVAAAVVLSATWLIAAANTPQATENPEAASQTAESAQLPLQDFQPSEKLPAGSAVAFPTDI